MDRLRELLSDRRVQIGLGVVLVAIVIAAVALAGGGEDEPASTSTTTVAPTTSTTAESTTTTTVLETTTTVAEAGPPSPLNGMPVEDATLLDRRVIAVKVDNHPNARPQSGVEQADAVWELLVEGGLTRFIALFHHTDVDYVGPIRSGRPTDPDLVAITGGPLTRSGAQDWVQAIFNRKGVNTIGEVRPATFRMGHRQAPHNLYGDTTLMREFADGQGWPDEAPTAPLFVWGDWDGGDAAEEIVFDWSDEQVDVTWKFQGGRYLRFTGTNAHTWTNRDRDVQEQVEADTLVVLEAPRYTACPSGSGSCVPAMETVGEGRALVFHGGEVVEGRWSRGAYDVPFALSAADGSPLTVPPGRMWINVFPAGRSIDW